ncbi:Endonuclease/exonuclease/phosphatase [Podospora fimiseda]|uniref:Endonuclease/exonuclease/phosphatase n=1 Tax=Podospora fimiseda TaxID=252190 RepID=A0AAN7BNZ0_9PEZI|nr:Endonuclease/exonuclease/phosphatase [Podospora fimiseda]
MTSTTPIPTSSPCLRIRLVTLNVRYAAKDPSPGEEPWPIRSPKLCAQLRLITSGHGSPFVCLQEGLYSQLVDIQARLGPSWGHIGQGRDDGKQAGEFSPIFFRVDQWDCERHRTLWLSKTLDVPSRGWDAALNRIVTLAQEQSAHLLLEISRTWTEATTIGFRTPVFLGGDFNSTPSDRAYKVLTSSADSPMTDVSKLVPEDRQYGITYTSFGEPDEEPKRIDFLFV